MLRTQWLFSAIIAAALSPAAMGFTIGFETAEGYSTGFLNNKPATAPKWSDTGNLSRIVDISGNLAGQFVAGGSVAAYSQSTYTPTAAQFGTTTGAADDPTASAFAGKVAFSLKLQFNAAGAASAATDATIKFGNDDIEFYVLADGTMKIRTASNVQFFVKDAANSNFDFDSYGINKFVTISGVADYSASTFTFVVNGVSQLNPSSSPNILFKSNTTNQFNKITFQNNLITSDANYRPITFDDISYGVVPVPEPASAALFGAGLSLLAFRRRNQQ